MFFVIFVAFWREAHDARICRFKINRHRESDENDISCFVRNKSVGNAKSGTLDESVHAEADDEGADDHFEVDFWGRWVFEAVRGGEHPALVDYWGSAVAFNRGPKVYFKSLYFWLLKSLTKIAKSLEKLQ